MSRPGKKDKAEVLLTEIAARPPDPVQKDIRASARPQILLAEMYERASQWSAAATQYENVLRLDPMQTTALYALSRVREKEQKTSAAVEFMESLATIDPKEPSLAAVGGIHQLFINQRDFNAWREFTKRLIAKYPENRDALYVRARSLTEENKDAANQAEAITLYEKIVRQNSKDANAQRYLAKELEAAGRKTEAITAYQAVLKVKAADTEALAALQRLGTK